MKTYIIDTNGFLRFILNDIIDQANKVESLITRAKKNKVILLIPQIVIFEISFALEKYYHFTKLEVINKIESILSAGYLKIQDRDIFNESIKLYKQKPISFVDAFLIERSKGERIQLFTFDKKLKTLAKSI